ncbi:UNVERIFIED_CONTAM: hypothetical protein K2H54_022874 [Gekko kuhli]
MTSPEERAAEPEFGDSPPEGHPPWRAKAPRRKNGKPDEEAPQPKEENKEDPEAIAKQEWLARTWDGWGSEEDANAGAESEEGSAEHVGTPHGAPLSIWKDGNQF